jgi:hypothetical protein
MLLPAARPPLQTALSFQNNKSNGYPLAVRHTQVNPGNTLFLRPGGSFSPQQNFRPPRKRTRYHFYVNPPQTSRQPCSESFQNRLFRRKTGGQTAPKVGPPAAVSQLSGSKNPAQKPPGKFSSGFFHPFYLDNVNANP